MHLRKTKKSFVKKQKKNQKTRKGKKKTQIKGNSFTINGNKY
jgi:hypothetical protein